MIHNFSTNKHDAMQVMKGIATGDETDLNLICPRAINKYRYNQEDFQSLINSIKNNGLFSAITINRIDKYLKSPDAQNLSQKEIDYYNYQLANGRQFFVSDGNRRFYAYCSLCVNKKITSIKQMDEFYKLYEVEKAKNQEAIEDMDMLSLNKYITVKTIIAKDDFWKERKRYNSANLDQRAIIDFEIVDNAIDNMKLEMTLDEQGNKLSYWDVETNKIKKKIVDSMTDRAIIDLIERIKNSSESIQKINNATDGDKLLKKLRSFKSTEDARNVLKLLPIEVLPRYKQEQVTMIKEYISARFTKDISGNSISGCRLMLDTYPDDLISLIYSGDIGFREAKSMLTVYKYLPADFAQELPKIIEEKDKYDLNSSGLSDETKEFYNKVVVNGKLSVEKVKKILLNKEEKKKISLSQNELIQLFRDINSGRKSFDQVYEYLKELNLV